MKIIAKAKKTIDFLNRANDPNITQYAASLSYHTVLSLIPILLIFLTIFTNMPSFEGYLDKIRAFIFSSIAPAHEKILTEYIDTFLQNVVKMGIMGIVVIMFVAIMFFKDYEKIMNKITHAPKRSFWQSLSIYWTLISLGPIGLVASFYLSSIIQDFLNSFNYTNWINFLAIFPYLVIWILMFTVYMISTNAQITLRAGLISSFVSSLVWYITKTLFVHYVAYNKSYVSIYGSFAIVFFFIIWVYISWVIFLYGVRLCSLLNVYFLNKKKKITDSNSNNSKHENFSKSTKKTENKIDSQKP